jgi:hypothetical protein
MNAGDIIVFFFCILLIAVAFRCMSSGRFPLVKCFMDNVKDNMSFTDCGDDASAAGGYEGGDNNVVGGALLTESTFIIRNNRTGRYLVHSNDNADSYVYAKTLNEMKAPTFALSYRNTWQIQPTPMQYDDQKGSLMRYRPHNNAKLGGHYLRMSTNNNKNSFTYYDKNLQFRLIPVTVQHNNNKGETYYIRADYNNQFYYLVDTRRKAGNVHIMRNENMHKRTGDLTKAKYMWKVSAGGPAAPAGGPAAPAGGPAAPPLIVLPWVDYGDDDDYDDYDDGGAEEAPVIELNLNPRVGSSIKAYIHAYGKQAAAKCLGEKMRDIPSIKNIIHDHRVINDPVLKIRWFMERYLYKSNRTNMQSPIGIWNSLKDRSDFFLDRLVYATDYRVEDKDFYYEVNGHIGHVDITPPELITFIVNSVKPDHVLDVDVRWGSGLLGTKLASSPVKSYHGLNPNMVTSQGIELMKFSVLHPNEENLYNTTVTSFDTVVLPKDKYNLVLHDLPTYGAEKVVGVHDLPKDEWMKQHVENVFDKTRETMTKKGVLAIIMKRNNPDSQSVKNIATSKGFQEKADISAPADTLYDVTYWST